MVDVSIKPKGQTGGDFQGPPRPRAYLSAPPSIWLSSPKFLEFMFASLRPSNDHSLPLTITKNQLNYLVATWNKSHPREAVSLSKPIIASPSLEDILGDISLMTAISQYQRMRPGANLNLATSALASPKTPIFTPTSPLTDKAFSHWVEALYNRGEKGEKGLASSVRLRLLKGDLNRVDLDWLCDRYEASHPKKFLVRVSAPFSPRAVSELFPKAHLPSHTLTEALVPIASYLLTGKKPIGMSAEQNKILSLIQRDTHGGKLTNTERLLIEGPVSQLALILPRNSPVVQLRMRHLQDAYNETFKLQCEVRLRHEKGELTVKDQKLQAWIPTRLKQIEESYKALPDGANAFRFAMAKQKDEIRDGDLFTLKTANLKLNDALKRTIRGEFGGLYSSEIDLIYSHLSQLPKGAAIDDIAKVCGPYAEVKVSPYRHSLELAKRYLALVSIDGPIDPLHLDNAERLLSRETPQDLDPSSKNFRTQVEKYAEAQRTIDENLQKGLFLTGQVVGTAGAIASEEYWAIPFIWGAGPTLAASTRAYVEDISICDAAAKEFKVNQIFGTPGSVIGEHLSGAEAPAWKLLILDILSMAALEHTIIKGATSLLRIGASQTESVGFRESVKKLCKERGIALKDSEIKELASGICRADENGVLKDIIQSANRALENKRLPENLRRFLEKQGGELTVKGARGIPKDAMVAMERDPRLSDPALSLSGYVPTGAVGDGIKQQKCFTVVGHEDLVMICVARHTETMKYWRVTSAYSDVIGDAIRTVEAYKKLPGTVNAPRVIGFQVEEDKAWRVMEKASGKELFLSSGNTSLNEYSLRLKEFANAPQAHFDKLISDLREIDKVGLQYDPSKPDNLFYDPHKGFILIDLDAKSLHDSRPDWMKAFDPKGVVDPLTFSQRISSFGPLPIDVVHSIEKIVEKLERAGVMLDESFLKRLKRIQNTSHPALRYRDNETEISLGANTVVIPGKTSLEIIAVTPLRKLPFVRTTGRKLVDLGAIQKFGWKKTIALQKQLEELYQSCGEDVFLMGHGTTANNPQGILKYGLQMKTPNISSTAVSLDTSGIDCHTISLKAALAVSNISQWPHMSLNTIVLLGIPTDVIGISLAQDIDSIPGLRELSRANSSRKYVVPPRYVVGFIDENGILHGNPRFNPISGGTRGGNGRGYIEFNVPVQQSADAFFSKWTSRLTGKLPLRTFLENSLKHGEVIIPAKFGEMDAASVGFCRHFSDDAQKAGYILGAPVYSPADDSIHMSLSRAGKG